MPTQPDCLTEHMGPCDERCGVIKALQLNYARLTLAFDDANKHVKSLQADGTRNLLECRALRKLEKYFMEGPGSLTSSIDRETKLPGELAQILTEIDVARKY